MKKFPVRMAIIGLGYWGPNFARLCFETEGLELTYCCDIDTQALGKIKQKYPAVRVVKNYREIVANKDIDAVIIVTPPETHYELCRNFLLAGKDVLVEKPMTIQKTQARKLTSLAKRKRRVLMVDHIFQYNSGITKLREYMKSGVLGDIFYLLGSYTALGPVRSDVNAILDLAPHHFYTLNFLLDKQPLWVSAIEASYLKEENSDVAFITIGYPGGVLAKVDVSWLFPFKVRNVVVVGEKKMALFDDTSPDEKLKIFDKSAFFDHTHPEYPAILKVIYREGDVVIPHLAPVEPLREVLSHFRDCIKNRTTPKSDGRAGAMVVAMLEAAQKSLKHKGARIKI